MLRQQQRPVATESHHIIGGLFRRCPDVADAGLRVLCSVLLRKQIRVVRISFLRTERLPVGARSSVIAVCFKARVAHVPTPAARGPIQSKESVRPWLSAGVHISRLYI